MHHKNLWCAKGLAVGCRVGASDAACCQAGQETSYNRFTTTEIHACRDKFAIVYSLTSNGQYLYHIVSLRPKSCIFEFGTSKFINVAYLIVL